MQIHLSPATQDRLRIYSELLQSLAGRLGLVHLSGEQVYQQIDRSLALGGLLAKCTDRSPPQSRLLHLDVGSGSGLPAIPMSISLADTWEDRAPRLVMIEPKRKAVAFLEKVVRELELGATVVPERAETATREWGSKGDFISAKALAQPERALELCAPLCKIGGVIVLAAKSQTPGLTGGPHLDDLKRLGLDSPASLTIFGPSGTSQKVLQVRRRSAPELRKGGRND